MKLPWQNDPNWWRGVPNKLTAGRIAAVPLLLLLHPWGFQWLNIICAFIFLVAAFTDYFDGYIARTYQQGTAVGALIDHIADKLLISASLVLLVGNGSAPTFMAALLIGRELAMSGMRLVAAEKGITVHVNSLGKVKTFLQSLAIFCLFINKSWLGLPFREVGMLSLWAALGFSLYSAYQYWIGFWPKLRIHLDQD